MKTQQVVNCVLIILLCCIFVSSCRTVTSKNKQPKETPVTSWPYYHWFYQYDWPYQYHNLYWYWWSADPVSGTDRTNGSLSIIEQYKAESEQLKKEIAQLEVKNEHLKAQLEGEKICVDFCEKLKAEDPNYFNVFDEKLTEFVEQHPREAKYLTVEDFQGICKQIRLKGESENTEKIDFGELENCKEKEQRTKSEESDQD